MRLSAHTGDTWREVVVFTNNSHVTCQNGIFQSRLSQQDENFKNIAMKLRLRLNKTTVVVELDQDCTLEQLKNTVTEKFLINEFHLSLNGRDVLENDEKKLVDHEIVPGDLIKILTDEQPVNEPNNSNQAPAGSHTEPQHNHASAPKPTANGSAAEIQMQEGPLCTTLQQDVTDYAIEDEECVKDNIVNRYLNEPVLIRDSTTEQVPLTLNAAWRSGSFQTDHQAMIPVLHVLMTEVGFVEKDKPDNQLVFIPSINITANAAVFKLVYIHSICDFSFTVMCVPVGPMLVIHGSISGEKEEVVCQLQIKSKDFISNLQSDDVKQVFKELPKLSRLFKDAIAYPLLQRARMEVGEVQENSLLGMIAELKTAIMSFLDVKSLLMLSQTCHEMQDLSQDPAVWRRLYLKDFGRFKNGEKNDLSQDWQKLYREKHIQRAQYRQALRNMTIIAPPFLDRPVPLAPLPFGPVYPPGAIGGDYDRGPNFGGFPGAIGPLPGAMFPQPPRPRFDPYGPVPGQNFRPGRGGGMWDEPGLLGDMGRGRQPVPRGGLGSGRPGFGMGFGPRMF